VFTEHDERGPHHIIFILGQPQTGIIECLDKFGRCVCEIFIFEKGLRIFEERFWIRPNLPAAATIHFPLH
jgi:hypothetical protein